MKKIYNKPKRFIIIGNMKSLSTASVEDLIKMIKNNINWNTSKETERWKETINEINNL